MSETMREYPLRREVGAVIIDEKGRVLILKRNPERYEGWGLVKGGIESGETEHEALMRELQEEICMQEDEVNRVISLDLTTAYFHSTKFHIAVVSWYLVECKDLNAKDLKCEPVEWIEAETLPFDQALERLSWQTEQQALERALEVL